MSRTNVRRMACGLLLLTAVLLAGCKGDAGVTSIKTLLDDPSQYDHKTVRIAGTVEESAGILGYGGYRLNDGTGTLTVVTSKGGSPRTGARIGVEGEFRSGFTLGTSSIAAVVEGKRYTPKE